MLEILQRLHQQDTLVNIRYVIPRKGPIGVWAKILQVDSSGIIIYDVDLKKVVNIELRQIDDVISH